MKNLKGIVVIIGFIILIPIIGIVVGSLVSHGYEKQYENTMIQVIKEKRGIDIKGNRQLLDKIKLTRVCTVGGLDSTFTSLCDEYEKINALTYVSIAALLFSILVFVFIYLLGFFAQKNRILLFYLFRPGLFISQICAAILVAIDAGIIVFSIYFAESFYLERVHFVLIGALGLVAALTAISVFVKSFIPIKIAKTRVFGRILSKDNYSNLWSFVENLAKQIGIPSPDTIIVGMDPTFFVTESKVVCLDGDVIGRTLFISLPFCRVLSIKELSAIIGHEMGHFIGKDTKWSKKFYPIYRGSIETVASLESSSGANALTQLSFLPAVIFMSIFIIAFEKSEKAISRQRELNADSLGAITTSKDIMASALVKVHIYQYVWNFTVNQMKEVLSNGQLIINISKYFSGICETLPQDFMKDEIGKTHISHPTDSHPSLSTRLSSMGIILDEIYSKCVQSDNSEKAIKLIDNAESLEEELSELEHHKLVQSGQVSLPDFQKSKSNEGEANEA